jgi:hypothetical protein
MINGQDLNTAQQLQVRRAAARHLRGIPARQNAAQIELLESQLAYAQFVERFGAEEVARCNALAEQE